MFFLGGAHQGFLYIGPRIWCYAPAHRKCKKVKFWGGFRFWAYSLVATKTLTWFRFPQNDLRMTLERHTDRLDTLVGRELDWN